MLRPLIRRRMLMNASQGAILLALHSGYDDELGRLQRASPWRYDPDQSASLLDRAGDLAQRVVRGPVRAPLSPQSGLLGWLLECGLCRNRRCHRGCAAG